MVSLHVVICFSFVITFSTPKDNGTSLLCHVSLSLSSPFPSCFLAGKERTAKRPKAYGGERSPQPCVLLSPPTQKYFTMMSPVLVRRLLDANLTLSLPQPSHDSVVFVGLSVFMPQQQGSFICVGALMTDTLLVAKLYKVTLLQTIPPFSKAPAFGQMFTHFTSSVRFVFTAVN